LTPVRQPANCPMPCTLASRSSGSHSCNPSSFEREGAYERMQALHKTK
jgi:hypothetical protein